MKRAKRLPIFSTLIVFVAAYAFTGLPAHATCDPNFVTQAGETWLVSPTGVDDTANIQCSLDEAVAAGSGNTVQLGAGQYYLSQVIARGFDGHFKGVGKGVTVIDVVGPNTVPNYTPPDFVPSAGEPEAPGSAALVVFEGGGNITISDMTFDITEENAAQSHRAIHGLDLYQVLDHIIYATFRPPGSSSPDEGVTVDNVEFKSILPGDPLVLPGIRNGLALEGAMITPGVVSPGDVGMVTSTPFTGSHRVTNCLFDGPAIALASAGLTGGSLVIGGSPNKGNEVTNANFGFIFIDSDNSSVEISHNVVATAKVIAIAVWQRQGQPRLDREPPFFRPALIPPKVLISHNNLGADAGGISIDIANFGPGKGFDLAASHNKITMKEPMPESGTIRMGQWLLKM